MGDQIQILHVVITFFFFFFPSFSKAILRTAELPSLCTDDSSIYQLAVHHFAMVAFMCIYWHYRINKQRHPGTCHLNSLKTFNHGLSHSKLHAPRQFCDSQCLLFLFQQLSMVTAVISHTRPPTTFSHFKNYMLVDINQMYP